MNVIRKNTEIANILRNHILSGATKDGKLPGERELCVQFQVARNTVRAALNILEQEGLIIRQRRTGTVIRCVSNRPPKKTVALIIRTTGHLFEDRYKCLLENFLNVGYDVHSISVHFREFQRHPQTEQRQRKALESMLSRNPPELIIYDDQYEMFEDFHKKISNIDAIPIDFSFDSHINKLKGVWNDYRKAGYLGGKYLIDSGCKRPVIFTNFTIWRKRFVSHCYEKHREKLCVEGFCQALKEAGIEPEPLIISPYSCNVREHNNFLSAFAAAEYLIPDGFFATADNQAALYMKYLQEFHGDAYKKVKFLGIGNTPWCQDLPIAPFSSICFDYQEIAENIIRMAETPEKKRTNIYIQPKLIIR